MPQITIRLFALAAQLADSRNLQLSKNWIHPPSVAEVAEQLTLEYPQMQAIARRSRWAINDRFVELNAVVYWEDQLAIIPPVSGG